MPASDRANSDMNPSDGASASPSESAPAALVIAEEPGDWAPFAVSYVAPEQLPESASAFDDPDLALLARAQSRQRHRPGALRAAAGRLRHGGGGLGGDPRRLAGGGAGRAHGALAEQQRRRIVPEAEFERLLRLRVGALRLIDAEYPRLLREIPLPPPVLYVRGRAHRRG